VSSTNLYRKNPPDGTVGIVIPMRDNLHYFKLAFHSVLSFTDVPYMLTIVDNMSTFQTRLYLRSLMRNHQINVMQYQEDFNYGAEVNIAMRQMFENPDVKFGLCLNSDTVVEKGWLKNLSENFRQHPKLGVVGPISNIAIPPQQIGRSSDLFDTEYVSGFCMMFRREVFEALDGFDERYVGGCYEDQDFCIRAIEKGWHVSIDSSVYIHHFWRVTRNLDPLANENVQKNRERFLQKFQNINLEKIHTFPARLAKALRE